MTATDYAVEFVPIGSIMPSPENDDIYGKIQHDEQMEALVDSIERRGLEEPILVTVDNFILSGHRRYYACGILEFGQVPIRRKNIRRDECDDFHRLLTEYNPQRVKTVATIMKESLLRFADSDPTELLYQHRQASVSVDAEFEHVNGSKYVDAVDGRRLPFLAAAVRVIDELKDFWPLSVRQVHYRLLNDPPYTQTCTSSKNQERWRYKNNKGCYDRLCNLLRDARYNGQVRMDCIDDATRPVFPFNTSFTNVQQFVEQQTRRFLCGYHRSPQFDQPRHIEVLGEKNTLLQIVKPVCEDYYVPLTLGRGYASIPVWRDMAARFRKSEKEAMSLVVLSDYDPEGLDLADDAIRSLRDMFEVPVEYCRVGVTLEQVAQFSLQADSNPAKETSTKLKGFLERTGGRTDTWELEALPPEYLQEHLRSVIESNMDMEQYEDSIQRVESDAAEIKRLRMQLVDEMGI